MGFLSSGLPQNGGLWNEAHGIQGVSDPGASFLELFGSKLRRIRATMATIKQIGVLEVDMLWMLAAHRLLQHRRGMLQHTREKPDKMDEKSVPTPGVPYLAVLRASLHGLCTPTWFNIAAGSPFSRAHLDGRGIHLVYGGISTSCLSLPNTYWQSPPEFPGLTQSEDHVRESPHPYVQPTTTTMTTSFSFYYYYDDYYYYCYCYCDDDD